MSIHKRDTSRGVRYDVRLRTIDGKAYTRTFKTRDEAKQFERNELTARDRGDWIDPTQRRRSFADVAEEWFTSNPAKRPSSLQRDRSALDRHILPAFVDKRIGAVIPSDVQGFVGAMTSGGLSPASVGRNYRVAAAIFRYATIRDYIAKSPCRGIKLPKVAPTEVHVFTPEELVAVAEAMPTEQSAMVWLGAVLGLRWGEVAALTMGSVDILGRTLTVSRSVSRGANGQPEVAAPKSEAGHRTLALPQPLADLLAAHAATIGATAADADALLFPDARGGLLRYSNWLRRSWWPAMVATGLGTLEKDKSGRMHYIGPGFHDLRRTSATGLVAAGVDVKTAQTRMGHSAVRLTLELYAQVVPEAERQAADALGERLMPSA